MPEVMEPGTCSLLDADVAPHWPAKPGVYIRGAFTRQMGQQQITRMGGGARCGACSIMLALSCAWGASAEQHRVAAAGSRSMCILFAGSGVLGRHYVLSMPEHHPERHAMHARFDAGKPKGAS